MKSAFVFDIKSGEATDNKFFVNRPAPQSKSKVDGAQDEIFGFKKKAAPAWILTVAWVILGVGFVLLENFTSEAIDSGFYAAYSLFRDFFYIGIALSVLGVGLIIFMTVRMRKADSDPVMAEMLKKADEFTLKCLEEMGVPETAKKTDVLIPMQRTTKSGKIKPYKAYFKYINCAMRVYEGNGNLYFADPDGVRALSLGSITSVTKSDKKVTCLGWNKSGDIKHGIWRGLVRQTSSGAYRIKGYYSLVFNADDEPREIIFPAYERDILQTLHGITLPG